MPDTDEPMVIIAPPVVMQAATHLHDTDEEQD